MSKLDARDWYIMIHISIFGLLVMAYAFLHPSEGVFATACTAIPLVIGCYHWFTWRDDKTPDARE